MINADKFEQVFGIYATELWAKPEKEFLEWLNSEAQEVNLISKNQSLVEWKEDFKGFVECLDMPRDDYKGIMAYIDEVPSAERTGIIRCKDCKRYDGKPCGLVNWYNTENDYCSKYEGKG